MELERVFLMRKVLTRHKAGTRRALCLRRFALSQAGMTAEGQPSGSLLRFLGRREACRAGLWHHMAVDSAWRGTYGGASHALGARSSVGRAFDF